MLTHDEIVRVATEAAAQAVAALLAAQETAPDANPHKASVPTTTSTNKETNTMSTDDVNVREFSARTIWGEIARRQQPKADRPKAKSPHLVRLTRPELEALAEGQEMRYTARSGARYVLRLRGEGVHATTVAPVQPKAESPAPQPKAASKADTVVELLAGDPRPHTAESVAQALGWTTREARTQLNNLTGSKCPARHEGVVRKLAAGIYTA